MATFLKSKIFNLNSKILSIVSTTLVTVVLVLAKPALSDDVGITKARLIQKSEKSYVVEADVSRALAWAVKAPIFPDRFQVSELEYVSQTGMIVVQATAETTGAPLSPEDEILLPWMRNGASLTVQWLDGTIRQGLFLRTLEGIHVPMRQLMPVSQTLKQVCLEHFIAGLNHLPFHWVHVLFAVTLVILAPGRRAFYLLLAYTFGQAVALVLADIGVGGIDLLFADVLGGILIFLMAVGALRGGSSSPFIPLVFIFGTIHALAYAEVISELDLALEHRIPALFMFNLAMDAGHLAIAIIASAVVAVLQNSRVLRTTMSYAAGSLSVAVILVIFHQNVMAGHTRIIAFSDAQLATRYSLPVSPKSATGKQRPKAARRLTTPVMIYLSVEPYEVRQEILIQARAAVEFLGVDTTGMGSIPVESIAPVKKGILDSIRKESRVAIDGKQAQASLGRAEFVTLGPAGVIVRRDPVPEDLDNGIIGITLVYDTARLPDTVSVNWQLFSKDVSRIDAMSTDPFGGDTTVLTPKNNVLKWKSRLTGYRVPVIEEVAVEKKALPVVSIVIFLATAVVLTVSAIWGRRLLARSVLIGFLGLGFVLYPFATYPLDLPWVSRWAPSPDRTSLIMDDLLTNVYRAFDVRDESRVYDRLSVSVTGDQLNRIYLESRKSLEFENRGGARASVDEVNVLAIGDVKQSENDGFTADAHWTVSGSVSHFGHTHYRQNRYHALVTFTAVEGYWKIQSIDLIDEERML